MDKKDLGKTAYDRMSGLKGTIVGVGMFLTGNKEYLIQPQSETGVKKPERYWVLDRCLTIDDANPAIISDK